MRHLPLLLLTGALLAASINIAKMATEAGSSPMVVAFCATAGAGLLLLVKAVFERAAIPVTRKDMTFYMAAGAISYALPNAIIFATANHVGAGYAATLHIFVPALTYIIATSWGLDRLSPSRGFGLALGMAGAVVAIAARLDVSAPDQTRWVMLALVAPASIALGNVVRSRFWPPGTTPEALAPAMLLAAGLQLAGLLAVYPANAELHPGSGTLLIGQALVSATFYHFYFRLQHLGGPVFLSQIGYVAAGFGLPLAALLFFEPLSASMLGGLALMVLGVTLVKPAAGLNLQKHPDRKPISIDDRSAACKLRNRAFK